MIITLRDKELMNDIKNTRYINSKTVGKLFVSHEAAMRRIRILRRHNLIRVIDKTMNSENIYSLTKRGYDVINTPYRRISKTDVWEHCLGLINIYFYFKTTQVIKEFELEKQYDFKFDNKKYSFRVDSLMETDRPYFVEMDLSFRGYERKIEAWEMFYKSGEFLKYFDKFPPIIIVSNDNERVKKIISRIKNVDFNYVFMDYSEIKKWEYKYPV